MWLAQVTADLPDGTSLLFEVGELVWLFRKGDFFVESKRADGSEHGLVDCGHFPLPVGPVCVGLIEVGASRFVQLGVKVPLADALDVLSVLAQQRDPDRPWHCCTAGEHSHHLTVPLFSIGRVCVQHLVILAIFARVCRRKSGVGGHCSARVSPACGRLCAGRLWQVYRLCYTASRLRGAGYLGAGRTATSRLAVVVQGVGVDERLLGATSAAIGSVVGNEQQARHGSAHLSFAHGQPDATRGYGMVVSEGVVVQRKEDGSWSKSKSQRHDFTPHRSCLTR